MMSARPLEFPWLRLHFFLFFLLLSGAAGAQASFSPLTPTCGNANGSITVTAGFGTGPWLFSIDAEAFVSNGTDTYTFDGLAGAAGGRPYYFDIQDLGSGTTQSFTFDLGDLTGPTIDPVLTVQPAGCLNNDGGLLITKTGGNGPFTYSINGVDFSSNPVFSNIPSGSLTASVKDVNGCLSSSPTPVLIPLKNDLTLTMGTTGPICQGSAVELPAVSNGTSFSWSPSDGLSDPTVLNPVASPAVTTPYTLTANRGICPPATASISIVVNPAPIANAGDDIQTCYGKTVVLRGSGGKFYHWTPSTGLTNPNVPFPIVLKPDTTITYALSVIDANGCNSLQPDSVTVIVTPPFKVIGGPDTIVSVGQPVQLYALGPEDPGGLSYEWTPATSLSNPLIQDPIATLNTPEEIDYIIKVTTSVGCTGLDTVVVKALAVSDILVPNAFSPNNDGHNDLLRAITPGIKTFKYFTIFDRWGRQVFLTSNAGVGWDGTLKGQALETGVYVWMAMGVDVSGKVVQRKGTVILVR